MDLQAAVDLAIEKWARDGLDHVKRDIKANITGKVLHAKPSGPLYRSIDLCSKLMRDGFTVGTDITYGIAWEKGFHRRRFWVEPTKRKALHWVQGSKDFFSRGHWIRAQRFPARPFIRPAVMGNRQYLKDSLKRHLTQEVGARVARSFKLLVEK